MTLRQLFIDHPEAKIEIPSLLPLFSSLPAQAVKDSRDELFKESDHHVLIVEGGSPISVTSEWETEKPRGPGGPAPGKWGGEAEPKIVLGFGKVQADENCSLRRHMDLAGEWTVASPAEDAGYEGREVGRFIPY